jgi:predicted heme/steroid binding protein
MAIKLTKAQLEEYNGTGGKPPYIAYQGKIYDMSQSAVFKDGKHFNHDLGFDLTDDILNSPHDEEVLEKFPVVGELVD